MGADHAGTPARHRELVRLHLPSLSEYGWQCEALVCLDLRLLSLDCLSPQPGLGAPCKNLPHIPAIDLLARSVGSLDSISDGM